MSVLIATIMVDQYCCTVDYDCKPDTTGAFGCVFRVSDRGDKTNRDVSNDSSVGPVDFRVHIVFSVRSWLWNG